MNNSIVKILAFFLLVSFCVGAGQLEAQKVNVFPKSTREVASMSAKLSGFWREVRQARRNRLPDAVGAAVSVAGPPTVGVPDDASPGVGINLRDRFGGPGSILRGAAEGLLLPWVAIRLKEYEDKMSAGLLPRTNANQCLPWALPGIGIPGGMAYSMNIIVNQENVVLMYELDHQNRIVHLNAIHPQKLTPSYFGHSVGHWEEDILVIDSIGFNDKTEIYDGLAHTIALHVIERIKINKNGQLEDHIVLEDSGAYIKPISFVQVFDRATPFQEYVCAENNHEADPGVTQ